MREFVAIDFEIGNPKRVSACALGYAKVIDGQIVESEEYLIKPVGGHAPFQSKIHGITDEHTFDKPYFDELFPSINELFKYPLVAYSLFDQQVLIALSDYFGLKIGFDYIDTSALAKQKLPHLQNHKLKTVAKYFCLPRFRHHDAKEDASACANICLKLYESDYMERNEKNADEIYEFKDLVAEILADDEVNYKEAYELLYWLDDHNQTAGLFHNLHQTTRQVLEDDIFDSSESEQLRKILMIINEKTNDEFSSTTFF